VPLPLKGEMSALESTTLVFASFGAKLFTPRVTIEPTKNDATTSATTHAPTTAPPAIRSLFMAQGEMSR
jgi:hypothetical protein